MPRKKKAFNKGNTEKFLLLRGSAQAVNADGETLQNILVPVSKNYKPGTSLLMSNIAALSCLEGEEERTDEPKNSEGFHCNNSDIFADASTDDELDAENTVENLLCDLKKFNFASTSNKDDFKNCENFPTASHDDEYSRNDSKQDYKYRLENLKMFNEKFEDVLEEYQDDEIGSLDGDEDIFDMRSVSPTPFGCNIEDHKKKLELTLGDFDEELKEKILKYVEEESEEKIVEIVTEKPLEYDCESILSTYSNIYNHPAVIKEERTRSRKTSYVSHNESESDPESHNELLTTTFNMRKKDETPEERKERQRKFKEAKRLRRGLKKQNKEAFKEEKKFQSLKANQNAGMILV